MPNAWYVMAIWRNNVTRIDPEHKMIENCWKT